MNREQQSLSLFSTCMGINRGFTLLEMLLVLGLIAVLLGMAGQLSLSSWQRQQQILQLDEVSMQLLYFLHQAESIARWHNATFHLQLQRAKGKQWQILLRRGLSHNDAPQQNAPQQNKQQLLPLFTPAWPDIALLAESASEQIHFFGRRGGAKGGHFTLSNQAGKVQVIVSGKGRIRRCNLLEVDKNMIAESRSANINGIVACQGL